jgi:ElaB/YqjD/DUF883 family membrane-anchored ribosome-binding protein
MKNATLRAVIADHPNSDIAALQTEINQLRADFSRVVRRSNGVLTREIEERPVAFALTAIGTGVLLGLLLSRRRA